MYMPLLSACDFVVIKCNQPSVVTIVFKEKSICMVLHFAL